MTAQEGTVAFIKGTVDGVVLWEPLASHALKRGEGKVVMTSKDIPVIPNGIYVQSEILENSPDMVVRALRSYFKGLRWGEGHSDEYYEVANKKLFYRDLQTRRDLVCSQSSVKMFKPKEIKERMKDNGQLYQYCQEVLNFYNDLGVVKSKPNLEDFIDNELYLGALGAYYE
jgi:ABC-type nitrate/sulfonate/bicarbonate transport system substrate-binding protein